MANEFIIKKGFHSKANSQVTGSLEVSVTSSAAVFSGSTYYGDGSNLTGVSSFPFTGDALISGSLSVTGSVVISGSLTVTGSFNPIGLGTDDTNVIIGKNAATNITSTSGKNVVIGNEAGGGGGTFADADGNVCIGYQSGNGIDAGDHNICIGYQAGYLMDANSGVTALGWQTLRNDGANYSVGVGFSTGRFILNGPNTLIGSFAGQGISGQTNARYNAIFGYQSGFLLRDGYYNTIIGGTATAYNLNNGYGNTILGTYAGGSTIDGDYNIIIGYSASLESDLSNQLFIGSGSIATISASLSTGEVIGRWQRPMNTHYDHFTSSISNVGSYNIVGGQMTCSIQTGSLSPGAEFEFFQTSSTGNFLFITGSDITLFVSKGGDRNLAGRGSGASLKYITGGTFHLEGDLS
tara:strand:+ start:1270 stop:2493 length:1224 start_codon:yes stop_codon:yes gene_type:complete